MRWRRSDGTGRGCGGGGRSRRQRRRRRFGAAMRRRGLWRRGIGTLIGDQWCRSEEDELISRDLDIDFCVVWGVVDLISVVGLVEER